MFYKVCLLEWVDAFIVRVHLSVSSGIKMPKGASATRTCGVLMVKKLNKCTISI